MTGFSRPVRIDTIGIDAREIAVEADAAERAGLAQRFALLSLDALTATASIVGRDGEVRATGRMSARLVQACVATNVDMPATIDVPFNVVFRSDAPDEVPDAGLELSAEECDVVFFDGAAIDLGEAVAETLALAIDPYPRSAEADAVLKQMGVLGEGEAGPFAVLAGLRSR